MSSYSFTTNNNTTNNRNSNGNDSELKFQLSGQQLFPLMKKWYCGNKRPNDDEDNSSSKRQKNNNNNDNNFWGITCPVPIDLSKTDILDNKSISNFINGFDGNSNDTTSKKVPLGERFSKPISSDTENDDSETEDNDSEIEIHESEIPKASKSQVQLVESDTEVDDSETEVDESQNEVENNNSNPKSKIINEKKQKCGSKEVICIKFDPNSEGNQFEKHIFSSQQGAGYKYNISPASISAKKNTDIPIFCDGVFYLFYETDENIPNIYKNIEKLNEERITL